MSKNGLILIKPTSVDKTGTGSSATISTLGSVEFSSCATLSLNGVFSADYDNYMIVCRHVTNSSSETVGFRLRVSGTDNSTTNSYVYQYISSSSTTVSAARTTTNTSYHLSSSTVRSGDVIHVYGPFIAQPTAIRNVSCYGDSSATIQDIAATHNQSTSYDGFTIHMTSNLLSGLVAVYGMRK